jgi:plastocyanin
VVALAALLVTAYAVSAMGSSDKASPARQASNRVTVNMTGAPPNFAFQGVPKTVKAGSVRFTFRNSSTQPSGVQHNFTVIRTFGQARPFKSQTLASGKSQNLTVNLRPGVYVAICTVGNGFHAANRMLAAFTVQ